MIRKGVDNYISILKENDLFDEAVERIKRKNASEPITLIKQIFENQSNFSEYLFSDLTYLDDFYEDFQFYIKRVIKLSFQNSKYAYQITTEFYDWQTKKIKASISFYSNGKHDEIDPELFASLINSSKMQWRIVLNKKSETYVFNWSNFGEVNLINFLNFINDICKNNNGQFKWHPIPSSYGSAFIFTTKERYISIIELNLT